MEKMQKRISLTILTILVAVCLMSGILLTMFTHTQVRAAGTWTAQNDNTTVEDNVIKSGTEADTNDYVAVYDTKINLADGFKIDFKVNAFQGTGKSAWDQAVSANNIAFALTGSEANATAQNAYVFLYTKHDTNPNLKLYTFYAKDFKLEDGKVSFSEKSGYYDNTTLDGSFDQTVDWADGMSLSLAGNIVTGLPMFWMNGVGVNPFGGSMFDAMQESATADDAAMRDKLREFYAGFSVDTRNMYLYAFNTSAADQTGEFEVEVESVATEYSAAQNGWVALDTATPSVAGNDVTYTDLKDLMAGTDRMSRLQFVYDNVFDLNKDTIEFKYSSNVAGVNWVTMFSIRGVGMYQLSSAKTVVKANYDRFSYNSAPTIGVYDNFQADSHAQAFGLVGTPVTRINQATEADGWGTWTVRFGKNDSGKFAFSVNGTQVVEYDEATIKAAVGDDLKVVLMVLPNTEILNAASGASAGYRFNNFATVTAEKTDFEYFKTDDAGDLSVNLGIPASVRIENVRNGETVLKSGRDYVLEGNILQFKSGYLNSLDVNSYTITVQASNQTSVTLTLKIFEEITFTFDDESKLQGTVKSMSDIAFSVVTSSADAITSVKLGDTVIDDKDDFHVTISADVLNALHVGTYTVDVMTTFGHNSFEIEVLPQATDAPVWGAEQADVTVDLKNPTDVVLNVDLKNAADYWLTVDGEAVRAAVFVEGTVTIPEDYIQTLEIGEHTVVVCADGRTTDEIVLTAERIVGKWDIAQYDNLPVLGADGSLAFTGQTELVYRERLDLSEGYTMQFKLDQVFEGWGQDGDPYVEFHIVVQQGEARFDFYIRTNRTGDVLSLQLIQQAILSGSYVQNNVDLKPSADEVGVNDVQTWSIRLVGDKVLTMINHTESQIDGTSLDLLGGTRFDDAELTVYLTIVGDSQHRDDTKGTIVGIGTFDEELDNIPAWAKIYFMGSLPAPQLRIEGNKVVWGAVDGAEKYRIFINGRAEEEITTTEFDFSAYGQAGDKVKIQVMVISDGTLGQDSALSEEVEGTITETQDPVQLSAPVLRVDGNKVVWDAVSGAARYQVYVNGEAKAYVAANVTEFDFSQLGENGGKLSIQVKSLGDGVTNSDSELSAAVEVTLGGTEKSDGKGCGGSVSVTGGVICAALIIVGTVFVMMSFRKRSKR